MSEIFNSSLEISLRMLIILNTVRSRLSVDRIAALDFISIYGKDFGVSEYNFSLFNDSTMNLFEEAKVAMVIMIIDLASIHQSEKLYRKP